MDFAKDNLGNTPNIWVPHLDPSCKTKFTIKLILFEDIFQHSPMFFCRRIRILVALFGLLLTMVSHAQNPVVIGILDSIDPWFYVQTFGPTMEYLRKKFPTSKINSVELSFTELQKAIQGGQLDFFIAPSGFFSFVAESSGARHIATRHPVRSQDPAKSVGSVFVVRQEDDRFKSLKDLRSVSVAATDELSFDGWIIALGEILHQNLSPEKIFRNKIFTGYGLPDVATLVLNRQADVGILKACDLERFEKDGSILPGSLRVLNSRENQPIQCKVSTELYPDVVFSSLPKVDSNLVKDITVALLSMPAAESGDRWGVASDFTNVSSLYKALEIGPYEYLKNTSAKAIFQRYQWIIYSVIALFVLGLLYTVSVRRIVRLRTADLQRAIRQKERATKEAQESRERLFQIEKAGIVNELSAMVAHEAHQPLASLINYSDGLKMYLQDKLSDPMVNEALTEISSQATRLSSIIQRVRGYARRETRMLKLEDLNSLITRAINTFKKSSSSDGIQILYSGREDAHVSVDALEIELLIVNLLRNSAVACRDSENKTVAITITSDALYWEIEVSDKGQKISKDVLQRLTQPVKSQTEGLGLGLSICRLIAESHGGRLSFRANEPKGLIATLRLPKA